MIARTAARGRLPDFLVIGARQGGSTPLTEYLQHHHGVFMPPGPDGVRFFSHEWHRGVAWYTAIFADARQDQVVGERSNAYTRYPMSPETPERAASVVSGAKLIYVVRHPLDRIEAQYVANRADWEVAGIDEAVRSRPDEYVAPSQYAVQIERWLDHFPREQLLVLAQESLRGDLSTALTRAVEFVGADPEGFRDLEHDPFQPPQYRRAGTVLRRARRSRFFASVRRRLPPSVRGTLRRSLSSQSALEPGDHHLSAETRRLVMATVGPDLERLRAYMEPSFDCWGLLSDS
jgi:hypothetical protein